MHNGQQVRKKKAVSGLLTISTAIENNQSPKRYGKPE
jgi:hypothetical protein